jgi:hypothetical protein
MISFQDEHSLGACMDNNKGQQSGPFLTLFFTPVKTGAKMMMINVREGQTNVGQIPVETSE